MYIIRTKYSVIFVHESMNCESIIIIIMELMIVHYTKYSVIFVQS